MHEEPSNFRPDAITRVAPDGSTTYIPESMVDQGGLTVDRRARVLAIAALGSTLACGALNLVAHGAEFIRSCGIENGMWSIVGAAPSTMKDCVTEIPKIFQYLQRIGQ